MILYLRIKLSKMDKLIKEILEQLYESYKLRGADLVSMNEFIVSRGEDPRVLCRLMKERDLIRFNQGHNGLIAAISKRGISLVAPDYFEEQSSRVLQYARS